MIRAIHWLWCVLALGRFPRPRLAAPVYRPCVCTHAINEHRGGDHLCAVSGCDCCWYKERA